MNTDVIVQENSGAIEWSQGKREAGLLLIGERAVQDP